MTFNSVQGSSARRPGRFKPTLRTWGIIDTSRRGSGRQVLALVELKALSENNNISAQGAGRRRRLWIVGLTHCKLSLVVRQAEVAPYCHIGTGNNPKTARLARMGLLT
jgi:polyphosphate kinase